MRDSVAALAVVVALSVAMLRPLAAQSPAAPPAQAPATAAAPEPEKPKTPAHVLGKEKDAKQEWHSVKGLSCLQGVAQRPRWRIVRRRGGQMLLVRAMRSGGVGFASLETAPADPGLPR